MILRLVQDNRKFNPDTKYADEIVLHGVKTVEHDGTGAWTVTFRTLDAVAEKPDPMFFIFIADERTMLLEILQDQPSSHMGPAKTLHVLIWRDGNTELYEKLYQINSVKASPEGTNLGPQEHHLTIRKTPFGIQPDGYIGLHGKIEKCEIAEDL